MYITAYASLLVCGIVRLLARFWTERYYSSVVDQGFIYTTFTVQILHGGLVIRANG